MTDSRGNKAGEQTDKGKLLSDLKWNENPYLVGQDWLSRFKKGSLKTSVTFSDWKLVELVSGELVLVKNEETDLLDEEDYAKYKSYLQDQSIFIIVTFFVECLYFGEGRLKEGRLKECSSGVAVFHDYSIGKSQRSNHNKLNMTVFNYPCVIGIVI